MKTLRIPTMLLVLLAMGWTASPAQDQAAKAQLKLPKKRAVTYTVTREEKTAFGDNVTTTTSAVTYKITRGELTASGDLVLNVEYVALKVKNDSERRPYEFDSSKEAGGGEIAAAVRKAISGPLGVTLSGGAIKGIKGFPESDGDGDDGDREARTRRFMIARIAGERTLRRDLELVLASAVQGQTLEEGKSYRVKRTASDDGSGRRRFRGFRSDVVFKFEGAKKNRAKFSVSTATPERSDDGGDRPQFERKETSEGQAVVTLGNGLLASLSLDSKSEISGDYQGREFSFTREAKVKVQRQRANKKAGQRKKTGKERNKGKKGKKAENSRRDA